MRVLLDECLPKRLAAEITRQAVSRVHGVSLVHVVSTVQQEGWTGQRDGELLWLAASRGFEAFVTADSNLDRQQNLRGLPLGVVVLRASSNRFEDLRPLVPELLRILDVLAPATSRPVGP